MKELTSMPRAHWPPPILARLHRLVRAHENSSVRLVVVAHVVMVSLDLGSRATYQTVRAGYLTTWVESPLWIWLGVGCVAALLTSHTLPWSKWALWCSASTFFFWGVFNLAVGLKADPPVSLLGPALVLTLAAPLAWTTAEAVATHAERIGYPPPLET